MPFRAIRFCDLFFCAFDLAEGADLSDEIGQIALQGGLAARDADAVENAPAFLEIGQDLALVDALGVFYFGDQACVMAKGAAEVAGGGEYGAGDFAGVVEEGYFLESVDGHGGILSGGI